MISGFYIPSEFIVENGVPPSWESWVEVVLSRRRIASGEDYLQRNALADKISLLTKHEGELLGLPPHPPYAHEPPILENKKHRTANDVMSYCLDIEYAHARDRFIKKIEEHGIAILKEMLEKYPPKYVDERKSNVSQFALDFSNGFMDDDTLDESQEDMDSDIEGDEGDEGDEEDYSRDCCL